MDFDDLVLSAEELDFLERDAFLVVSQRNSSSSSAPCEASSCQFSYGHNHQQQVKNVQPGLHALGNCSNNTFVKPTISGNPPFNKLNDSSPGRRLPNTLEQKRISDCSKGLPQFPVKFFLHATGNVAAKFAYEPTLVAAFKKVPKSNWNSKERLWLFPISSLSSAEQVLGEICILNVEIENLDPLVRRAIAAVSAIPDLQDWYVRIPIFIESKLLPFQRDGVRFVLQHGGRALLADEMGLGKTIQAIAVSTCVYDSWPVLVLTPSSLRLHWASMLQEWLHIPSSDILVVLSQGNGLSNRAGFKIVQSNVKGKIFLDGVFNIVSYDTACKLQSTLLESDFKVVIADESHFLKNAQAKRTSAAIPVIQKAQYAILLSGTPALSRPIELFKQLEALHPHVYKNVHEYGTRYCKGGVFGLYQGASNHEELHNLMKATVMIRRLKKDVLSELPKKRRQHVFLDVPQKDMKQINALFRELEDLKCKIQTCKSSEEVDTLKFSEKNLINKIYNDSAEAKIPAVLDYLSTFIEEDCKFLIFAHHQPMIDAIHKFLLRKKIGCIRIDGTIPPTSRQPLVVDFQENDSIKAAVLSIKAGGVGLTLTAATSVLFAELSWTPGDLVQAEDRAHRIGQVSSVNIYYLLANDTVDDIIWDVVQNKLENLGQMLDGQDNTLSVSGPPLRSPAKQGTLSLMKRCDNNSNAAEAPPLKLKHPRQIYANQKTLDSFLKRPYNNVDDSKAP